VPPPDLVLLDADICTMDPLVPRARALAVTAGRVSALGPTADIRGLAAPGTRVIHAAGRLALPGFQDTHIHLQDSGHDYATSAPLDEARTLAELQAALAAQAAARASGWVKGVGWYTGVFHDGNLTRAVLDAAVPDRPAFILAADGHNACLNSAGCAAIGLGAATPDPPNGHIVRDAAGAPTGMLHEDAIFWATARLPAATDADYAAGVRHAQALANRHGITGVLDAHVEERHVRVYAAMARAAALTVRVAATAKVFPHEDTAAALARLEALRRAHASEMFRTHSAKFFLDGVLENRTAAMLAPWSDAKGGNAPLMFGPNRIAELFTAFDAARFQIHVHAIGDAAVRAALDGLEAARAANGAWPSLHQIAHVQCIDPADIPRFRPLGAVANLQPLWARPEPAVTDVAVPMLGPDRARLIYAFRSLLDAGAPYTLSSDWGVSSLNPFAIIATALTRQAAPDGPAFLPDQRLTLDECIRGYTTHAAAAAWRPDTGTLAVGAHADLILLDRDVFSCDTSEIAATRVMLTLIAGREVHRATDFDG
jgi:predicted amidohydrolase YtcJ